MLEEKKKEEKKDFDILETIKQKDEKKLYTYCEDLGKVKFLSEIAQFLDRRAYVTIDTKGEIKRKKEDTTLAVFGYLNNMEKLVKKAIASTKIEEKQKYEKIERLSSVDILKVKKNFMKTLYSGNMEFSKRYGKELFLRDRTEFFKTVANFSMIGDKSLKPLLILAVERLLEKEYDENIFYLFISFMTKYKENTTGYEMAPSLDIETSELAKELKENSDLLNSLEGLKIISTLYAIDKYKVDNRGKALGKIRGGIANIRKYTPLDECEKELLEIFL